MPWLQPQTNNYFGFMPFDRVISVNPYLVSSSEGVIYEGDPCIQTSLNTVRALTSAASATPVTNFTSSMAYVGVAAQTMLANTGSTGAVYASTQMILLYDAPDQLFTVCDTTSGVIGSQTGQWKNVGIQTTGAAGTSPRATGAGRSNVALSGVTSTVAGVFHVHYLHPIEAGIHSTVGAATAGSAVNVRKWVGRWVTGVQVQPSTGLLTIANTTS